MTASQSVERASSLYNRDFCLWAETTAELLRQRQFTQVDVENLIEEIEGMSRTERQALLSNLRIVLLHLLKYKYQPAKRSQSWLSTIREHRTRLEEALENSPSLRPYFLENFDKCYQKSKKLAADETSLSLITFPGESLFTPEEALNEDFLPE